MIRGIVREEPAVTTKFIKRCFEVKNVQIGSVKLANPVVLAPMAGITDSPFRKIVKQFGPGLLCGEMVSAAALHFNSSKTLKMIGVDPAERPLSIQIFGSKPELMAEAAQVIAASGADIIDINMGCPVTKVVKNGEGAALMNNLPLAAEIIATVVRSVSLPVTVKFRLGWEEERITALELARIAEASGAAAVTVHGRTRNQFYHGKADWNWIRLVKQAVGIPVIGNGDVDSPAAARLMLEETGCDGVMIGRAALGRPWLFAQVATYIKEGRLLPEPPLEERFQVIRQHLELQVAFFGERHGVKQMRKHLAWYFKGLPGAARMRDLINTLTTKKELDKALAAYEADLKGRNYPLER
ncbi:MAG TPA: tRNA dihydrouridine synthase DusB [Bacillota bacterium]